MEPTSHERPLRAHDRRHDDPSRAKTNKDYIRTIKDFAAFLRTDRRTASFEDVRRFQMHLGTTARTPHLIKPGALPVFL